MTGARVRLTSRGRGLIAIAVILAASGYLFGLVELYPLGAATLILVVSAREWVARKQWDVRVSRVILPARVAAGAESRVLVSALNIQGRRSPVVMVRDRFENGEGAATFGVAPLQSGGVRTASYRLPGRRRGVYRLLPLEVSLGDPLGLAECVRTGAPGGMLTVHPQVETLPHRSIPSEGERDRRVPLPHLGRGGDEFYGLREYLVGDDLRHIHWASTARTDELMIRQAENVWRGRTTIVVDARTSIHTAGSLESVLSAAASLSCSVLRAGSQARLVVTGGVDTGLGSGAGHEASILDALAGSQARPGRDLGKELHFAGLNGPLVVLTTDAVSTPELGAVMTRAGLCESVAVVFAGTGSNRPAVAGGRIQPVPFARRCTHVVVPAGVSFRSVWMGAMIGGAFAGGAGARAR